MADGEMLFHAALQLLFGAFAAHLVGMQVGLYGWNRLFVVPENRGRVYMTVVALGAAALWPQFFPAAARVSVIGQIVMLQICIYMFVAALRGPKR